MKEYYTYQEIDDLNKSELKKLFPPKDIVSYMKQKQARYYISFPGTFDIETTSIIKPGHEHEEEPPYIGFMYHWQFSLPINYNTHEFLCITGRRWEEFLGLLNKLKDNYFLNEYRRMVIYDHGLFFEFQFIRNFVKIDEMFARHEREPLKFIANDCFEFRCSYYLTNMSLGKAISNTKDAIYKKLSGDDFDYRKLRTPDTPLTKEEIEYCLNDVRGLQEVIGEKLKDDTLASIPLTSTGYIRREVRNAVLANPKNQIQMKKMALSPELYAYCHEAFRGGNSNSNPYLVNQILEWVKSFDRKSSYPAEMVVSPFPVSPFVSAKADISTVENYKDKAMLMVVTFFDIDLKSRMTIAYIPVSKCINIEGDRRHGTLVVANGRIIKALSVTMVITDIDYRIIMNQYNCIPAFTNIWIANYGHLNDEFRKNLMEAFVQKTKLERGDKYLYNKFKNKINAYFGMMVTDICAADIQYIGVSWKKEKNLDIPSKLKKYYNNRRSFLNYQQGVWVTANARYRHQQGIVACGHDIVMGDTDSCKFIMDHEKDFERLNQEWLTECYNNDISPIVHVWEKPTVLGIWEQEKTCSEYVTIGAKKHAYIYEGGGYGVTVAGLNKEKGAKWLEEQGGLDAFCIGTTIPEEYSGRTVSWYNDEEEPYTMAVNGCTFLNGSNIGVRNTTYTIGVSDDYLSYLVGISEERVSFDNPFTEETEYDEKEENINKALKKEKDYA